MERLRLLFMLLVILSWTAVDAEPLVGFVETMYTVIEGGGVEVCVGVIGSEEDITNEPVLLEVTVQNDNHEGIPHGAYLAIPDTIDFLGLYNMDPMADYPPPLEGRIGQIRDSPITRQTRVVCFSQITYDDDIFEGDEYFSIKLVVQWQSANVTIEPSHSSAVMRIIDNDISCSRESDCSDTFFESTVSSCCVTSGVHTYNYTGSEMCNLCYVYGWVQEIAIDHESALPQLSIIASEGEEIPLNIFFLSNGPTNQDIFQFTIESSGSATDGVDYNLSYPSLSLTDQPLPITLFIVDDDVYEETESVTLTLMQNATLQENQILAYESVVVTLEDNDNQLTIEFSEKGLTVSEDAGAIRVAITLQEEIAVPITVNIRFTGTAIEHQDYTSSGLLNSTVIFNSRGVQEVIVDIVDDVILETTEPVIVTLSNPLPDIVVFNQSNMTISIIDNDIPVIGFEKNTWETSEEQGYIDICVTAKNGPLASNLTVNITLLASNAMDDDFTFNTNPPAIAITAGTSRGCLTVQILSSDIIEGEEHIHLAITTDATVENGTATIIIINDGVVTLGFNVPSYTFIEGEMWELDVSKSGPFAYDIPFRIYAKGLIDENGTFAAGVDSPSSIAFPLSVTDDNIALEPDDNYTLTLLLLEYNPQVSLTIDQANVTIIDDDSIVTIGFDEKSISVAEDNNRIHILITLLEEIASPVSVDVQTHGVTATPGQDYSVTGMLHLTFEDSGTLSYVVDIVDDSVAEDPESFTVTLTNPQPAAVVINSDTVNVTIIDNDGLTVSFEETNYTLNESAGEVMIGIVAKSGTLFRDVVIRVDTRDGSAKNGSDYGLLSTLLKITIDDSRAIQLNVTIPITNDTINEGVESFFLVLTLVTNDIKGITISQREAKVEIKDDDVVVFGYKDSLVSAEEGKEALSVTVIRTGMTSQQFTFTASTHIYSEIMSSTFSHSNISDSNHASPGVDYSDSNITFIMTPEENDYVVQFEVFDDKLQENSESFFALLQLIDSGSVGAVIGRNIIQLTIVDDDDPENETDSFNYNSFMLPTLAVIVASMVILIAAIAVVCRWNVKHLKRKRKEMSLKANTNSQSDHNEYQMPNISIDDQKFLLDENEQPKKDTDITSCATFKPDVHESDMKTNAAYGLLLSSSNSEYADPRSLQSRARPGLRPSEVQSVEAYAVTNL